jgi:hypothetical protein
MGHAPWLRRVLLSFKEDATEGARPLPWITPSLVEDGATLTWTSSGNTRTLKPNKTLAFCPGAVIDGIPQPFVVGTGAINSPVCQSILISIANPRVYHTALHSGSDSNKEFGLHIFPKSVLRQLEAAQGVQWLTPLQLSPTPAAGTTGAPALPKNLVIRFGAHRASIYGASRTARSDPLIATAKDPVREAHARDFIANYVHAEILDAEFPEYQALLDSMNDEVPPIVLPCLTPLVPMQTAALPSTSGQKRTNEDLADTGASGSGSRAPAAQMGIPGTTTQEGAILEEGQELPQTRDEIILAFAARPALPEADQLFILHINSLMALMLFDGPVHKRAVHLLSLKYDLTTATTIWEAWEPYISPPAGHPLDGEDLAKNLAIAILCESYPTQKQAKAAAKRLVDGLMDTITTQTFIDHTAVIELTELEDEEQMEVLRPPPTGPRPVGDRPIISVLFPLPPPLTGLGGRDEPLPPGPNPTRTTEA